jgi:hypothetical protein
MYLLAGDYEKAIEYCGRATRLSPNYANAWADLFLAYSGQAEAGKPNVTAMRRTLAQLKTTARGNALLMSTMPEYESLLRSWSSRK